MKRLLVKFDKNYADEFDCEGFKFFSEDSFQDYLSEVEKLTFPRDFYFGTNEALDFDSFKELKDCFTIIEISEDEYLVMKKLFPNESFCLFPEVKYLSSSDEDCDDDFNEDNLYL